MSESLEKEPQTTESGYVPPGGVIRMLASMVLILGLLCLYAFFKPPEMPATSSETEPSVIVKKEGRFVFIYSSKQDSIFKDINNWLDAEGDPDVISYEVSYYPGGAKATLFLRQKKNAQQN